MNSYELSQFSGLMAIAASAANIGLFDQLLEGDLIPLAALASRCEADQRAFGMVIEVLKAHGLVDDVDGRLRASAELRALDDLLPGGFAAMRRLWTHVPTFLRTGEPMVEMDGDQDSRSAHYENVVARLGNLTAGAADSIAAELGGRERILDLGAGSGVWSLAMASLSPTARVCAVDFPAVLPSVSARARDLGIASDRIDLVEGDLFGVTFTERFDRIVMANVLHLEPPLRAREAILRSANWLEPGGELVIVGSLCSDTPEQAQSRALYAVHLAMRTTHGENHSAEQLEGWCREAGLEFSRLVPTKVPPLALGAFVATR